MTSSSISRDSIFSYFFITPPKRNEWIFTLKNVINKTPTKMTRQWLCHPPQKKRWKSPEFNWGLVEHSPKTRRLLGEIFFLLERKLQNHGGWNREKESLENINGIILTDFLFNWALKTLFFWAHAQNPDIFLECMQRNFEKINVTWVLLVIMIVWYLCRVFGIENEEHENLKWDNGRWWFGQQNFVELERSENKLQSCVIFCIVLVLRFRPTLDLNKCMHYSSWAFSVV